MRSRSAKCSRATFASPPKTEVEDASPFLRTTLGRDVARASNADSASLQSELTSEDGRPQPSGSERRAVSKAKLPGSKGALR